MSGAVRCLRGVVVAASILVLARSARPERPDAYGVKTEQQNRYERQRVGSTPEEWARHLDDPRSDVRLEAVDLLAQSSDPKALDFLMQAVESSDPRVATAAVEALGRNGVKDASRFLAEHLFLAATSPGLRKHILVALGRIHDPATIRPVLDFIEGEADPELRGTGIRVIGEIGDASALADLRSFEEREKDPALKALVHEAVAKIEARQARAESPGPH